MRWCVVSEEKLVARVTFDELLVDMTEISDPVELPASSFDVYSDPEVEEYWIYYLEAYETFRGQDIERAVLELTDFLNNDPCVKKVGKSIVTRIEDDDE